MSWRVRVFVVVLAAMMSMQFGASPAGSSVGAQPVALHLDFQLVARHVFGLSGSGRYVGYTLLTAGFHTRFVLVDDRTGRQTLITPPCQGGADGVLGAPWVAFDCGGELAARFRLYNIETGRWQRVPCALACRRSDNGVAGVGAKWLALVVGTNQTYVFYNIATGRQRTPRVSPTTTVDLNSPDLVKPVCSPLREPPGIPPFVSGMWFFGRFAVAPANPGWNLERCGSHLQMPLITPDNQAGFLVGNTQAVGASTPGHMAGIFLPSLQRFTATVQAGLLCEVLGSRRLYAVGPGATLWAGTFPAKPPSAP